MALNFLLNPMNLSFQKSIINFSLTLLILLVSINVRAEDGDRILESINITEEQGYSIIDITLNQQMTVSSYTPLEGGERLRIKVKKTVLAFGSSDSTEDSINIERLPWKPSRKVPLFQVTLDLSDEEVLLEFNQSVKYKVRGGTDAFHILIEVSHSEASKKEKPVQVPVAVEIKQLTVKGAENPKMAQAMQDARTAMVGKDFSRAVQLYTKVILDPSKSIYVQDALEYLGLAREKKGQLAHAKVAYKKYLKSYPEGENAERVQQRLTGVLTARADPKGKLRKGRRKPRSDSDLNWTTYGSVSQFYNRNVTKNNDDPSDLTRSSLQNNLDITSRLRSQDYQVTGRFSGAYEDHLETSRQDQHRVSSFYADFKHKTLDSSLRIGRQSRSTGGVLGRFDGVLASFPAMENVQLNLVAGYSVESSKDVYVNDNTYFYGISADLGTYFKSLDFNAFFIEQIHLGQLDRRAMGGEIRYFQPNRSFFTFLDYDIHHDALNTFLFTGQYIFPDRTTFNVTFDQRKSPLMRVRNATTSLQGVSSVEDLLAFFNEDQILQLARERSSISRSFNLGLSRPLTKKLQFNADFRWSKISNTQVSTGLPVALTANGNGIIDATTSTGDDYSYSTDLTANSILKDGDLYTIGVRYSDTKASNTTTFTLNTRYPITRALRINPRFRLDLRDNIDGTTKETYRPSVRLTYRILKALQLEVESGAEWQKDEKLPSEQTATDPSEYNRSKGYFVIVGYRLDF